MVATTSLHATFTCARLCTVTVLYYILDRYEVMWDACNIFFYYFTLILFIIVGFVVNATVLLVFLCRFFLPSFMPLLLHYARLVVDV